MRRSVILHRLCHLIRADFIERTQHNSFIIVVAMTVYISYSFVPPAGSDFVSVALERWRGVYNSAWLGIMFGLFASLILSLFAFYLVKDTIERDRHTRVGQIIALDPGYGGDISIGRTAAEMQMEQFTWQGLSESLERANQALEQGRAGIMEVQGTLRSLRLTALRIIDLATVALAFIFILLGAGQVLLFERAWKWFKSIPAGRSQEGPGLTEDSEGIIRTQDLKG